MPCTPRRPGRPRALRNERLGPGRSAAPDEDRLVLLPSGPDTVRESPLRGTRSSTSLEASAFEDGDLGREFSPAGADCRYRAPLVPRLARLGQCTADRLPGAHEEWQAVALRVGRTWPDVHGASVEVTWRRGGATPARGAAARSRRTLPAVHATRAVASHVAPGPPWEEQLARSESSHGSGGGEGGIRTRDALPRTAFPVRRHSPLGDLSPRQRYRDERGKRAGSGTPRRARSTSRRRRP